MRRLNARSSFRPNLALNWIVGCVLSLGLGFPALLRGLTYRRTRGLRLFTHLETAIVGFHLLFSVN